MPRENGSSSGSAAAPAPRKRIGAATIIQIKVKPNAREDGLEQLNDGTWLARIKSPPVDGKANDELIRLIAERFRVAKARVSIKSGATGRLKRVRIEGF